MKTITFTPHEDLQLIPEADREKWADALDVSIQHKGAMCNEDDTAHCCLCIAERVLNNAKHENYGTDKDGDPCVLPELMTGITPITLHKNTLCDLSFVKLVDEYIFGNYQKASVLNDKYLNHKQIAQLLRGQSVTIEVES